LIPSRAEGIAGPAEPLAWRRPLVPRRDGAVVAVVAPSSAAPIPRPMSTRPPRRPRRAWLALAGLSAAAALLLLPDALAAWGEAGHRMVGAAAAEALPAQMPEFVRRSGAQLSYLNPEPDRWRDRGEQKLDSALERATAPDHFIDMEMIPAARRANALGTPGRFTYADTLRALGLDPSDVGMLPYRIVELTQQLRVDFRNWRMAKDDSTRRWIEQRVIDDAGILGHYVADGSNPAHTSIHYNGWEGDNPNGYATDRQFHGRFESGFVRAQVTAADVRAAVARLGAAPQAFPDARSATLAYLNRTNALVERMYQLDKASKFDSTNTNADNKRFVADRLAAGAVMLRDLWWTAWVTSEPAGVPVRK
jgi:hypothetical protein